MEKVYGVLAEFLVLYICAVYGIVHLIEAAIYKGARKRAIRCIVGVLLYITPFVCVIWLSIEQWNGNNRDKKYSYTRGIGTHD